MIHRVSLVSLGGYYDGPCDVCVSPPEVSKGYSLSELLWVRLCDEHLPVGDLLKAARVLHAIR